MKRSCANGSESEWRASPIYDLLPPSTQVVPSESILDGGVVDDTSTIALAELSTVVTLSRQQVIDDDLSDALVFVRRAANAVARGEDAIIFKGQELGTDNYTDKTNTQGRRSAACYGVE